jgi:queuine tRNA-ribosyltransferase
VTPFDIRTRAPDRGARTGTLRLAHGEVRTPAFVPLATKAVVKTLEVREVAELGYDMVLGNTFHLFLTPGHELIRELGGLHRFQRWNRPIITDSGGFQVFSMGHGAVADEIKGRSAQSGGGERAGGIVGIEEEGVTFRSYLDGSQRFMGPETSMEVQAALGSDIALVFDECTPFNVTRDYTARSTERTHRWLDRCLDWHAGNGPEGQVVYGIVQGGVEEDLRRWSAQEVAARDVGGIAIGGTLGEDKDQMFTVVEWTIAELGEERPRHLLGIGEVDDLVRGVELGVDTFDCAMPTRIGRHGMALVPEPERRWRVDLAKARWRAADEPLLDGCPCPACAHGYSRAYLHYLLRAREQTAQRLLTIHNLAFLAHLMEGLRAAIDAGRLPEAAAAVRAGAAPWALG